ncbi:hypothetical protein [uncultured Gammaproteobacteria bacterium]|nr:hypothetical protein [uncultured Gammaproteobacteria bacterium]
MHHRCSFRGLSSSPKTNGVRFSACLMVLEKLRQFPPTKLAYHLLEWGF